MRKRSRTIRGMMSLILLAIGACRADYAPLKVGNLWVYDGSLFYVRGNSYAWQGQFQERLSLEVLSRSLAADTVHYRIRMRDSLFARKRQPVRSAPLQTDPDTVISQVLTFATWADHVILMPYQSDSGRVPDAGYSLFQAPRFLLAHADLPGQPVMVPGSNPVSGAKEIYTDDRESTTDWTDWYVNDVGLFYEGYQAADECGIYLTRNLYLSQFNGKNISIGVDAPAAYSPPLPKEAYITCSLRRDPSTGMRARFRKGGRAMEADMAGRALQAR